MTRNRRTEGLALLGLARRSGGLVPGFSGARESVRSGDARLVVLADDAARPRLQRLETLARARGVAVVRFADRLALGTAVGRAPVSAVAVTNGSLAKALRALLAEHVPVEATFAEGLESGCA